MSGGTDGDKSGPGWWALTELFVGGGLFVYVTSAIFGGIWYFATQDSEIGQINSNQIRLQATVGGLDNAALGSRLSRLEGEMQTLDQQTARIEGKIDQILLNGRSNR